MYQQAAAETRSPFTHAGKGVIPGLAYTTMGLASEVGEVANHAKKVYRDDGGTLTKGRRTAMIDELGDVLIGMVYALPPTIMSATLGRGGDMPSGG